MRIGIVVPSGDMIHADMAWSLAMNVQTLTKAGIPHVIINPKCSLVQKGRYIGVKQAMGLSCTHIMFIDSDMVFPPTTILQLLSHKKSAVGCYYPKRDGSGDIVGCLKPPLNLPLVAGLREANSLGTGMLLVDLEVVGLMPHPLFHVSYEPDDQYGKWESEDEHFCKNLGVNIWCDCDLSKEIGHIGSKVYRSV